MKRKKPTYNTYRCKGINNAIALLDSDRFQIVEVCIARLSAASKNKMVNQMISGYKVNYMDKDQFYKKYPDKKSQGILIKFSGQLTFNALPNFQNSNDVCLLALDQISDPQNFGQIIRTSECAGVDGIIFPKYNASSVSQTVLDVSQGAFVSIPLYEITNLSQELIELKKDGFWVVGIENNIKAKAWHQIDYNEKIVIVVGSEGKGIRKKILGMCDFIATIEMQGKSNSLNVSAATSAVLFERLRQMRK